MLYRRAATIVRLTCLALIWALLVAGVPAPRAAASAAAAGVTVPKGGENASPGGRVGAASGTSAAAQGGAAAARVRAPVHGRPAGSLPDLNAARALRPKHPHAPPPVRSTLRNCPPRNPRCNAAPPAPTRASTYLPGSTDAVYLAALGSYAALRPAVAESLPLLDFVSQGALSDSSPTVFSLPSLLLGARELLPALYAAAVQGTNNAQYVEQQSVPSQMTAGQTYNVSVRMRNTGSTTWSPQGFYRLGIQAGSWNLGRVDLPSSVQPASVVGADAATVVLAFTVTAPLTAGTYNFQWRMVQDGVEWFGETTPNVAVTVVAPQYAGAFETAGCDTLTGWAWDSTRPNTPIQVDLFADGNFVARSLADQYRAGLAGDGRHGFSVAVPAHLRNNVQHTISARVANTFYLVGGSPALAPAARNITCAPRQTPYRDAVNAIPGTVQAENFDEGGQGVAYSDTDPGNNNSAYRSTGVDVGGPISDAGGGYAVGWVYAGEWLGYTVSVAAASQYTLEARVASSGAGGTFHVEFNGVDKTGTLTVPSTGGAYQTITKTGVQLNAGRQIMRVVMDSGGASGAVGDFNYFRVAAPAPAGPMADYDAVRDFSATNNSTGAWRYGYRAAGAGSSFTPYTGSANLFGAGLDSWSRGDGSCCPMVTRNSTGSTTTYVGVVTQPTNLLNVHPGPNGERSVVRWTSPSSGTFQIAGRFEGIDTVGTTTGVQIVHNNATTLHTGSVNGYGNTSPFTLTRAVTAGDAIEFIVGDGGNNYGDDSTGLAVTITAEAPPPPPADDAVAGFSSANNPSGPWRYGYRAAGTTTLTLYTSNSNLFGAGLDSWSAGSGCCPMVTRNTTSNTINYVNVVTQPPNLLNVHPGPNGQKSVVRWTATSAGTVQITGRFQGIDTVGTTTDVAVAHNGAGVFSGVVNGYGSSATFSLPRTVAAGDTVEFIVGDGGNSYGDDSTGLAAAVGYTSYALGGGALPAERLSPLNRTGGGGVDLLSGNFNWSLPLISLRGRAGLDLGLSVSYNSLVWTRDGSSILFNPDEGSPAPGFRLGFPVVQPLFYNPQTGKYAYLLVTPGGARVELRQTSTPGAYDSADSSYLRLTEGGGGLTLRPPDGSRMTYAPAGGQYVCTRIEDRNGNFITIDYDSFGGLKGVTDTLGRVVEINYDANHNPISITQERGSQTHAWATFGYGAATVQPGFTGVAVVGPSGQAVNALTQVGLQDGSSYRFDYNPYGQVSKIARYSADDHLLSYTAYDYAPAGDNCPRVEKHHDWALDWNNGAEAVTEYAYAPNHSWGTMTAPDQTLYKEVFETESWKAGLTKGTEVWVGGVKQKYTETKWDQDDLSLSYRLNPRVTSTLVGDADGNRRRTSVDYYMEPAPSNASVFGLAKDSKEYEADATAVLEPEKVLRRTHTEYNAGYNLGPTDTGPRIIGLVSARYVYGKNPPATGSEELYAKSTYVYDEVSEGRLQATPAAPAQHVASFGTGYTARGNLTSARRWSVKPPYDVNTNPEYVETKIGYDTAGSALFSVDPANHRSEVSYSDSFSDSVNRNTFAYPTATTDPDQVVQPSPQRALTRYDFSTGAVTRVQGISPDLIRYPTGPVQTMSYDEVGRVTRVERETDKTGATIIQASNRPRTLYVYSPGQTWVQSFTTIKNAQTEAYSIQVMDGAGRVYATAADFPGGAGPYRAQHTVYDVTGRAVKASDPTAVTSAWEPVDEDTADNLAAGWYYSTRDYDWKGRPTYSTAPAGGFTEMIYGGCGCAGGEVVTVRDAMDRRQKVTHDVLGRVVKAEVLNPGGASVYSTTTTTYNALDQATRVFEQAGESGAGQESLMNYDGHGRLASSKAPSQTGTTTYSYYNDDTRKTVRDTRGATATYTYDNRHLVTGVAYAALLSPLPTPSPVSFEYDAAGNRKSMTDGTGSITYAFNALSQMISEEHHFADFPDNTYTLSYDYTSSGLLEYVSDWAGFRVDYAYDAAGQLSSISGTGAGSAPTYASNFGYRAWGAIKDFDYGNGVHQHLGFDAGKRMTSLALSNVNLGGGNTSGTLSHAYDYYADGRINHVDDLQDNHFDRAYTYDHAGRLKEAFSGVEAWGGTGSDRPFRQSYTYDVWENVTARSYSVWNQSASTSEAVNYTDNKREGWTYDTEGRVTAQSFAKYAYDAAGRQTSFESWQTFIGGGQTGHLNAPGYEIATDYDGAGMPVKRVNTTRTEEFVGEGPETNVTETASAVYYVHSSVLGGQVVAQLDETGARAKAYVYAGGMRVAELSALYGSDTLTYEQTDPVTGSRVGMYGDRSVATKAELDPLGADVTSPPQPQPSLDDVTPPYLNARFQPLMLEYQANWTGELEIGMAQYLEMVSHATNIGRLRASLRDLRRDEQGRVSPTDPHWEAVMRIIAGDPNLGVSIGGGESAWGAQAAAALSGTLAAAQGWQRWASSFAPTQGASKSSSDKAKVNDCKALADFADKFAGESYLDTKFVYKMQKRLQAKAGTREYDEFRGRGFMSGFQDENGSYNQVRHFVGTMAGAYYGALYMRAEAIAPGGYMLKDRDVVYNAALLVANSGESSENDKAVNNHSVRVGVDLALGYMSRDQVGKYIRDNLCDPNY